MIRRDEISIQELTFIAKKWIDGINDSEITIFIGRMQVVKCMEHLITIWHKSYISPGFKQHHDGEQQVALDMRAFIQQFIIKACITGITTTLSTYYAPRLVDTYDQNEKTWVCFMEQTCFENMR